MAQGDRPRARGPCFEHLKVLGLQHDLDASDRFVWFSTTSWMMCNYLESGLTVGSPMDLFDGNPAHPTC